MTQHPHPNLGTPSKLADGGLRIVALGGISEIGRNMTVYETNGKLLIIDCGVLFPEDNQPGIDLILPDFSYIRDRLNDVVGLFLTHGHEDHIGAVPYLLRERGDIPVYGSALTIALIAAKCKEHRISPLTHEVREGNREDVGPFELEFIAVNHSIPDALAVAVHTKAGTVLHTGDFKMDQLPLDGRITDLRTFARLGEEGVDLFLVDSTNADVPGFTPSEREIMPALNRVIASTKRRVIVASFSSHVHRVQQVIDTAALHNRRVAFIGRSNAGKSSAINALTSQNKLARTSKTPGRTQLLNYFTLAPGRYLVDVPGFGYAKVSADMQRQWQHQLERYLQKREVLSGLVLLMDIRHPFMDSDNMMINWCSQSAIPLHILLTKADKLTRAEQAKALSIARLQAGGGEVKLFSALKKQGVDEVAQLLWDWTHPAEDAAPAPAHSEPPEAEPEALDE